MGTIQVNETVGEVVARHPGLSRVFEEAGVDYCCGGKKSLEEVCREKGFDPQEFVETLEDAAQSAENAGHVDTLSMSLTELADHIVQVHHGYLRKELPRLSGLTEKVARVHGEKDARLEQVRGTFAALTESLSAHTMKEEQVLFPMIRQLEASDTLPAFHCGSIGNPIRQMESEHQDAGAALETLRRLTDGHTPPDWACNTYRAMLDALAQLERDLHQHIHKEDSVLFPRAIELESTLRAKQPG